MKKAYSALMAVIIMGAVMMIVALTLVNLGGDSNELGVVMADRYYVRNLAKTCSEKALRYVRSQEDIDEVESYRARKLLVASDDTMIWSGEPTLSYGDSPSLALNNNSAILLRFDVANNLPADAQIESAKLRLYSLEASAQESEIKVYKVLQPNGAWSEGNNEGSYTSFFEPNWNWLDYGSLTPWAGSPGMASPGVDYYAIPEAGIDVKTASSTAYDLPLNPETVAGWLQTSNNYGLVLKTSDSDWLWFAAKETAFKNQWPVLDVIYSASSSLSVAGGINQSKGYCFYDVKNLDSNSWLVKTTAISDNLWSFEELKFNKASSSPGMIEISSWRELSAGN